MTARPQFSVGSSRGADPGEAAREACAAVRAGLGEGAAPTLVAIFPSPELCEDAEGLLAAIHRELAPEHLIGAMGEAVVAGDREIEEGPALAVWAARLPGVEVFPFRLVARPLGEGMGVLGWPDALTGEGADGLGPVVMLADPFSFPADGLLAELNGEPGAPVIVGGLASGGHSRGRHKLFAGGDVLSEGAVAVALRGVRMHTVVSQGCLPIGPEMVVTAAEGSHLHELAGVPALIKLQEVVEGLGPTERALARDGLLTGLVIDENTPDYARGDFLVRPILGGDRETGALVVGERVRVGQTMRFHVRDAASADGDLRESLHATLAGMSGEPGAALLFSCNGRGTNMFPAQHHDAVAVADAFGRIPVAGLFCNGEFGPIGGQSFLHGFTATMVVFETD